MHMEHQEVTVWISVGSIYEGPYMCDSFILMISFTVLILQTKN